MVEEAVAVVITDFRGVIRHQLFSKPQIFLLL